MHRLDAHTLLLVATLATRCGSSTPAPALTPRDATSETAPSRSARYLALGDSFTIGTGSSPEQAFPARLVARWGAAGCEVALRNPAVNGFTTQDVLDRELPLARPFAPTVVTLAVGANDLVRGATLERYRAQVRRILDALSEAGVDPRALVALPQPDWARSPASASFGDPAALHAQIVAFNAALREEVTARGGRYVDLFPLMEQQARDGRIAGDGLHPDAASHDAWAAELARALPSPCGR